MASKSKIYFICRGGWYRSEQNTNDLHGRRTAATEYKQNGCLLIISGIICALLAPAILLPSSIGMIPIEFSEEYFKSSSLDQYIHVLRINSLVVVKSVLGIDHISSISLPKVPESNLGSAAITGVALLDFVAILCVGAGVWRIYSNIGTWRKNNPE